jgi:glycosyltransferase involved in cell wall biosynthesis
METLKLLYIDTPFIGFSAGDKNRSKFLYESLLQEYTTDVCLVENKNYSKEVINSHIKNNHLFKIKSKKQDFYKPNAILNFDEENLNILKKVIINNSYDICFLRFASMSPLSDLIRSIRPDIKIIIDVDMLFSQISKVAWSQNRTLKNRYHFFEYIKLFFFEKQFFNKNYNFLYTNKNELELVKRKYSIKNDDKHYVLPNVINKMSTKNDFKRDNENYILFYGVLNSTANLSAYEFLIYKIYPLLKSFLILSDIKIYIVGKNQTSIHTKTPQNVKLIGEVDDLTKFIKNSLLVLFPLTVASGTLTRILEVASLKKSIVATSKAANGLDLEGKIFIANKEEDIVNDIKTICTNKDIKIKYEQIAYNHVNKNHTSTVVKQNLKTIINEQSKESNVLHIPRRFTKSHWGGTENVILSIANGLKKYGINSKIVTTNILCNKKEETINNIKVKRFSYFYPYFNLSNKNRKSLDLVGGNLFSWSLFYHLFFIKDVDLIHLHTAKRLGSIARTICKFRNIPYVVTIHGGLYDISSNETQNRMQPTQDTFEWGKILGFLFGSRKVYDDANSIITLNQKEYEQTKKVYPKKDVHLLSNSVNIKQFEIEKDDTFRKSLNIDENSFVFLSSGRIDKQKNQLLTLKCLKELIKTNNNIHLLLVGNVTDAEYLKTLNTFIKDKELESFVTIITNLKPNSSKLINAYLNADAFVLASRHEPFGIVALEAWASKLPLIVSDICGVCSVIKENKTALVFKDNNQDSLYEKMQILVEDKNFSEKLVSKASAEVLNYDESIINNTLSNIYKNLIKSTKD